MINLTPMIEAHESILHELKRSQRNKEPGGAQKDQGIGVYSFLAALSSGFVIFAVQLLLFLLFRNKLSRIFKPKSSLDLHHRRPQAKGTGLIPTINLIRSMSDGELIRKCGLDAYFFLRYLKTLLIIFSLIATLAIPILVPLNYVGGRGSQLNYDGEGPLNQDLSQITGLDTLAWGNVRPKNSHRYWAHLVMAVIIVVWTCAVFFDEMRAYIKVRQDYLTGTEHRSRPSSSTILVNSIPTSLCTESKLKEIFSVFPGEVVKVWINRDFRSLLQKITLRNTVHQKLEAAEADLIKTVQRAHKAQQEKKNRQGSGKKSFGKITKDIKVKRSSANNHKAPPTLERDYENNRKNETWMKFLDEKDRPTHRLPRFGWDWLPSFVSFGKREDTIYWCREELKKLNSQIKVAQESLDKCSIENSAFIQFDSQIAAHMACQSEVHHLPEHMTPRIIGFCPEEIIWKNVALSHREEWVRTVMTYSIIFIMISLWSIPVAWTGALSQIDQLIQHYNWFAFIGNTEVLRHSLSAIAGLLPTAILTILLYVLPALLELLAEFKGVKTLSLRDEFVQKFYFVFLFIQLFLVVSIASFFTTSIKELAENVRDVQRVSDLLDILARNLPKASNYFFSYMVLQSLSTSSATLLQIGSLIEHYIIAPIVDKTPRDMWTRSTRPHSIRWGSVLPAYTNFACIALIYCVISPLISIFAILLFGLLWLTQRYVILYVYQGEYDTGGILYPRAINQTFTGIYVMELCLTGLFFIAKDERGRASCTAHGIIMVIVLVGTVLFQIFLNWRFSPLLRYLPVELGDSNLKISRRNKTTEEDHCSVFNNARDGCKVVDIANDHVSVREERLTANEVEPLQEVAEPERGELIATAFDHIALNPRTPTVWIPQDELGVSADEIRETERFDNSIIISNEGASLDDRENVIYTSNPPDFSKLDRVKL